MYLHPSITLCCPHPPHPRRLSLSLVRAEHLLRQGITWWLHIAVKRAALGNLKTTVQGREAVSKCKQLGWSSHSLPSQATSFSKPLCFKSKRKPLLPFTEEIMRLTDILVSSPLLTQHPTPAECSTSFLLLSVSSLF